jgi:hypothetical protein
MELCARPEFDTWYRYRGIKGMVTMTRGLLKTGITLAKGGKMATNKSLWMVTVMVPLAMLGILFITTAAVSDDVPRMTKEELKGRLGDPNVIILDVRTEKDWKDSDLRIKGAIREDPNEVNAWLGNYPKDKTMVLYCA